MKNAGETKKITVGVIGLGMGKHHIEGYLTHPDCAVVAVADPDAERLAKIADQFQIEGRFDTGEALIDSGLCDVVSIAVPNKFHRELAIRALEKGCHVLCEKPMAMNAQEAEEMLKTAKRKGKRLMINFSYRFTSAAQALKSRIDAGELGDAYYGRTIWLRRRGMPGFGGWFGKKELAGGGPLIDLGVHRLDLALWFMGYPAVDYVAGATYDPIAKDLAEREGKHFSVEDLAVGFIRFKNGATLSLEASWAANIKENEFMETRILGTRGGLVHRNLDEGYSYEAEFFTERDGNLWDQKLHEASGFTGSSAATGIKKSAMSHFIDAIQNNRPHDADAEQGLAVMKILDALYKSAETGKPEYLTGYTA